MEAVHAAPDGPWFRYNQEAVIRTLGVVAVLAWVSPAHADEVAPPPSLEQTLEHVRALYGTGDFAKARDELLAAYEREPRPELLFALGQVEFNLREFARAIAYYERFLATNPSDEQTALAQQAIGAAHIELDRPRPPPPPPPPHREWDVWNTTLVAGGGALGAGGGALLYYAHRLSHDRAGLLYQYTSRLHHARNAQWEAVACFGAGALAVTAALLRYRFNLVDSAVTVQPVDHGVALVWERPL
jgi:tetratricopeptide (TPR) repeat protein